MLDVESTSRANRHGAAPCHGASFEWRSQPMEQRQVGMCRDLLTSFFEWAKQPDPGSSYNYSIGFTLQVPGYDRGSYSGVLDYYSPRDRPGSPANVFDDSLSGLGLSFWVEAAVPDSTIGHYDTVSISIERWPTTRIKLRMVESQGAATARCVKLVNISYSAISPVHRVDAARSMRIEGSPEFGQPRQYLLFLHKIGSAAVASG